MNRKLDQVFMQNLAPQLGHISHACVHFVHDLPSPHVFVSPRLTNTTLEGIWAVELKSNGPQIVSFLFSLMGEGEAILSVKTLYMLYY